MVEEIRERRALTQTRTSDGVYRYARRFYKLPNELIAVMRFFDGPETEQGFYIVKANGSSLKIPKIQSWAKMERILEVAFSE